MDADVLRGYSQDHVQRARKDETIFLAGALGQHMYVVLQGQVDIEVNGHVVDRVHPGGIFGEMALIDNHPRSGTAVATTETMLLRLDEREFIKLVGDSPAFSLKVMRIIAERLRRASRVAEVGEE